MHETRKVCTEIYGEKRSESKRKPKDVKEKAVHHRSKTTLGVNCTRIMIKYVNCFIVGNS